MSPTAVPRPWLGDDFVQAVWKLLLLAVAVGLALAAAVLPLFTGVGLIVGGAFAVVVLLRPIVGLVALAFTVPFGSIAELNLGGLPLSGAELLVGAVTIGWLAAVLSRRSPRARFPWPLLAATLFVAVIALELTMAPSLSNSLKELLRWVELVLVAVIGANTLQNRRSLVILLAAVLAAGILEATVGWYQFFLRVGPPSFAIGPFLRAHGTFGQPNPFAGYLVMVWPLAAALALYWLSAGWRRGNVIPLALGLLAMLTVFVAGIAIGMSLSRGAWLGLIVAGFLLAGLYRRRLFILLLALVTLAVSLVLLGQLDLLPPAIGARLSEVIAYFRIFDARQVVLTPENWAIVERMARWQAAWGMFDAAPIFGVGPGHYELAYPRFGLPSWPDPMGHAHNYYLNVLAETGAVGLGAYLLMLGAFLAGGMRLLTQLAAREVGGQLTLRGAVITGVLASLVAASVHNLFDNLYVHSMNVQVGLLLGLMLATKGSVEVASPAPSIGTPQLSEGGSHHQRK